MEGRGTEGAAGAAGGMYMGGTPPGEKMIWKCHRVMGGGGANLVPLKKCQRSEEGGRREA